MSQVVIESGSPTLPYYVNDHGRDNLRSITVASGAAVLNAGQVLAKRTAPAGSARMYDVYNNSLASGLNTAAGILHEQVDPTNGPVLASMFTHGTVRSGSLTGLDAGAITDLSDNILFV